MTRARDLNIPFDGTPGPNNAITDVDGTAVGHETIISGRGPLKVGEGPVRTGVTAVLPRGYDNDPVFAGWYALNGNGEMTGTTWVEESGFLQGPVMITNTHSVGIVHDAVIAWIMERPSGQPLSFANHWSLPVVAETYDGWLNDINGFHVRREHVFSALNSAKAGPVGEGNVGGGTGMTCHGFKGGIGTASRVVKILDESYTVGVLVQANHGARRLLTISGVPVGREITNLMYHDPTKTNNSEISQSSGSIIVVVATDAPLLPHHLKRLARRVPLGIGRVGGLGFNSSGDIFIAYSTANPGLSADDQVNTLTMLSNHMLTPLFEATVQSTEEAIVNALVAADTMEGINGRTAYALPHHRLVDVLRSYNRLTSEV